MALSRPKHGFESRWGRSLRYYSRKHSVGARLRLPKTSLIAVELPYGMTAEGVVKAVNDMYAYLHALNKASIEHGYNRLEDLMQPAGFSGLLSNAFVRSIARQFGSTTPGLAVNQLGRGRPSPNTPISSFGETKESAGTAGRGV